MQSTVPTIPAMPCWLAAGMAEAPAEPCELRPVAMA